MTAKPTARKRKQHRTCRADLVKAYWEADISTVCEVAIRLSDNDRWDSNKFLREVARKLKSFAR